MNNINAGGKKKKKPDTSKGWSFTATLTAVTSIQAYMILTIITTCFEVQWSLWYWKSSVNSKLKQEYTLKKKGNKSPQPTELKMKIKWNFYLRVFP